MSVSDSETDVDYEMEEYEMEHVVEGEKSNPVRSTSLLQQIELLRDEVTKLKHENATLRQHVNNLSLPLRQQANTLSLRPPIPNAVPEKRELVLYQVIRTPNGKRLDEVESPFRFSASGSFPHAVVTRHNERCYQIERRRPLTLAYSLHFKDNGYAAKENDINSTGSVQFQLSILYADDLSPVSISDFSKFGLTSILEPSEKILGRMNMVNGQLTWRFRFNVSSGETMPRNRRFVARVFPVMGQDIDRHLECYTVSFSVASKVSVKKTAMKTSKRIPCEVD